MKTSLCVLISAVHSIVFQRIENKDEQRKRRNHHPKGERHGWRELVLGQGRP
jgi:hypothetical protein